MLMLDEMLDVLVNVARSSSSSLRLFLLGLVKSIEYFVMINRVKASLSPAQHSPSFFSL
jgi:hypothetical protein